MHILIDFLGEPCERYGSGVAHFVLGEKVDRVADRVERILLPVLLVPHVLYASVKRRQILKMLLFSVRTRKLLRPLI